jgi:molybdopterin molybdotransferase/putative molybdopterin biosynthesis protein
MLQQVVDSLRASTERIPTRQALNRVLSSSLTANRRNPASALAAMDGIAVNCSKVPDALFRLKQDQWQYINTGDLLPDQFNAVVRIEDVQWEEQTPVLLRKPNLYENVRTPGEDFEKQAFLLPAEHKLQPQDISLLLAAACDPIEVYKKPIVTFIPTGSELVNSYDDQSKGKIFESNSAMVEGFIQFWGGEFRLKDLVPDDPDDLAQMLKLSVQQSDVVVVSAGTSKGTKDLTAQVIRLMGKLHFHGVKMTPGKPVVLGEINSIPIVGLPGYPAAAYVCSLVYLRPMIAKLSHVSFDIQRSIYISSEEIAARNQDSFYRVCCFEIDGQSFVRRVEGGAGSISALSDMDGLMHVPPQTAIKKRDGVRIDVVGERSQTTITIRGAGDPALEWLFNMFRRSSPLHRILFWHSSVNDALQSIVERNLHIVAINAPANGPDPFEEFARQLQEPMLRYRVITRTAALTFRENRAEKFKELPKGLKIAVPENKRVLWNSIIEKEGLAPDHFQTFDPTTAEKHLVEALRSTKWDGMFTDIRFLTPDWSSVVEAKEHLDLVIPGSYSELPGIRKLIEILMSEEFWIWTENQKGCDVSQRGSVG